MFQDTLVVCQNVQMSFRWLTAMNIHAHCHALLITAVWLFLLSGPDRASAGDCTFAEEDGPYDSGDFSNSVAMDDLDGDGDRDLAVANEFTGVSVLFNNGDGTFPNAVPYTTGGSNTSVAIGDLDGDGDADLAVASASIDTPAGVYVLLNQGGGNFGAAVFYGTDTPVSVAIGDLDGDSDRDLAVANYFSDTVSVLLNQGGGTFVAGMSYPVGDGPREVAIGDLNGDGDADLAVANEFSNNVSVLINQGPGIFAAAVAYGVGDGPYYVAIGDLDGVGDADLAVANSQSDDVSVLLNQGAGAFAAGVPYGVGDDPLCVAIGDLDGDGDADLAVANSGFTGGGDNVSVLCNQGDGIFAAEVLYSAGDYPFSVAIGDLDGDDDADLAVANNASDNVSVLSNQCALFISSANPPLDNPYIDNLPPNSPNQPFRDVLQDQVAPGFRQGIGSSITPSEGPYDYSTITVTFSVSPASLAPADINVTCSSTGNPPGTCPCPWVTGVFGSGVGPYTIALSGAIPPGGCTDLTFGSAAPGAHLRYEFLPGDANMDNTSNTLDLLAIVQALNDGTANQPANKARYDMDRTRFVNTTDLLRLVQLLNGVNTTRVWNGATLVPCEN